MHAEWSACLNFLSVNRQFFKEKGFKSKVFSKSDVLLDYVPKRERKKQEQAAGEDASGEPED